jgi:acyl-CoA synthetase (AMP-forming)/AMP-acid ligase II
MIEATAQLTTSGGMFETSTETVLGERMQVFRNRPKSLAGVLASGRGFGDREYLVFDDGRRYSYGEFPDAVYSVASGLSDRFGIGMGDRIAIFAANCPEWILTFWACAVLGAQLVAMNGWWTESEARLALESTDPKLLVVDEKRGVRLGDSGDIPTLIVEREFDSLTAGSGDPISEPIDLVEDDPVLLLFTSGTTGRPKAAVLSHRIVIAFCMTQMMIGVRAGLLAPAAPTSGFVPTSLAVFPLFHISGLLATAVSSQMSGQKTVWPMGRFNPNRAITLTREEGVNLWVGGTTHIVRLLEDPACAELDGSQLRGVGVGGSASTPEIIRRIEARFPHLVDTVSSGYGSTESGGMVSSAPNFMLKLAPECVGLPHPTVEVRIVDDDDNVLADGQEGNIEVRSPMVMLGYWENKEANSETFTDHHWLRTGDFGHLEDGLLFLASRRRDLIIRGSENVYPIEVENCLESYPGVEEVAVYGVDDSTYGQTVFAVVVPRQGASLDPADLRRHCSQLLAPYKVPVEIDVTFEPLPRTATGKVIKGALSEGSVAQFIGE